MQLDLVPQLQELEVHRQRGRRPVRVEGLASRSTLPK
jgi:hypothetical protein